MSARIVACGGVDSSHGAGLDADREAAQALGVQLLAVPTCHTVQDAQAVHALEEVPPRQWGEEARALLEGAAALKLGLLPGAAHLEKAARLVRELAPAPAVLDPVIAASSGRVFLDSDALDVLRDTLLAAGPIVTPNLPEAALLAGIDESELAQPAARVAAARCLVEVGAAAVVVKGGHGGEDPLRDLLLVAGGAPHWIERPRQAGSLRGTGCRFATALAGCLALGQGPEEATKRAGELVAARIARG